MLRRFSNRGEAVAESTATKAMGKGRHLSKLADASLWVEIKAPFGWKEHASAPHHGSKRLRSG